MESSTLQAGLEVNVHAHTTSKANGDVDETEVKNEVKNILFVLLIFNPLTFYGDRCAHTPWIRIYLSLMLCVSFATWTYFVKS